jgi:hypothetical protein
MKHDFLHKLLNTGLRRLYLVHTVAVTIGLLWNRKTSEASHRLGNTNL